MKRDSMADNEQTPSHGISGDAATGLRAALVGEGSQLPAVDLRTLVPSHPEQADQVAQLLDAYGLFCEANLAVSTVRVYRSALGLFFRWWKAHHPRLRLAPPLLHHYKKWLMTATDERGEVLSARTINNYLAAVRAFCAWLKRHEKIAWEAGAEIPDVRVDNKTHERRPLSPAQVTQLMGTFDDSLLGVRDAALCYLMVKTGIRAVQVERADWGDLEQTEHGWILKTQGKGQRTKEHFVLVLPEVMARLERYRVARGSPGPREPLFIGHHEALTAYLHLRDAQAAVRRGEPILEGPRRLTIRAIQLRITRAMAAIGVREAVPPLEEGRESLSRRRRQRRVTPHSLRHTAASEAAKTSSPFQVQTMLDHKDVRTTQKYFHALNRLEEGAERAITSY